MDYTLRKSDKFNETLLENKQNLFEQIFNRFNKLYNCCNKLTFDTSIIMIRFNFINYHINATCCYRKAQLVQ